MASSRSRALWWVGGSSHLPGGLLGGLPPEPSQAGSQASDTFLDRSRVGAHDGVLRGSSVGDRPVSHQPAWLRAHRDLATCAGEGSREESVSLTEGGGTAEPHLLGAACRSPSASAGRVSNVSRPAPRTPGSSAGAAARRAGVGWRRSPARPCSANGPRPSARPAGGARSLSWPRRPCGKGVARTGRRAHRDARDHHSAAAPRDRTGLPALRPFRPAHGGHRPRDGR